MVYKIRLIALFIISIFLCVLGFTHKSYVETNLLKTLLPKQIINSTDIVAVANKSSALVKVVFESDNQSDLEELKQNFNKSIDADYYKTNNPDVSKLLEKYISQPANFLSEETRQLLLNKKYDEIYDKSIENLYNPTGIQLSELDKNPYLLVEDFIMSNKKISNEIDYLNGRYYDFLSLKIENDEALSPDLNNKKIKQIIELQRKLSDKNSKIYLAGTPIHSYYTSIRSTTDINIICILSTLMIVFLTYLYFKNLKLLLPIALSIIFGMLLGYVVTKLWFESFQIITMVFSTTLIGIGIDYSYHYFFANVVDKNFIKNLSFSLLTTVVPFTLLYLTKIELLQQVSIFTIFGLIGIYLVILFIYPCFKYSSPVKMYIPKYKIYKICLFVLIVLSFIGIIRFHFNDSITSLYSPSKELLKAEKLYNKISGESENVQIITVKGNNIGDIIQTEESITKNLKAEYIALSKLFPSEKKQKENFKLVKELYNANLNKYSDILSKKQIQDLKNAMFVPVKFDNLYFDDLLLDSHTSIIIVFGDENLNITDKNASIVNLQTDIMHYMKHYRHILLLLFPIAISILYILLSFLYCCKTAFKILIPSLAGMLFSLLLNVLIYGELNLFSIITIFLVLGFTIDYSIFRINSEEKTESSIWVSCLTTSFSFLLLAFCGFKLLSSMALVLFFGILIAYLSGYILLKDYGKIKL